MSVSVLGRTCTLAAAGFVVGAAVYDSTPLLVVSMVLALVGVIAWARAVAPYSHSREPRKWPWEK